MAEDSPQEGASQAKLAEILRQCESAYWKRTAMPLVLWRLESGKFDKNEMRVMSVDNIIPVLSHGRPRLQALALAQIEER